MSKSNKGTFTLTDEGLVKKPALAPLIIKLVLLIVAALAWTVFGYWTLWDAAVLAEGGLEARLAVFIVGSALFSTWQVAKVVYSRK